MKKLFFALLLIAAFCLLAVSPVVAHTYTPPVKDEYAMKNVTSTYKVTYDSTYKINKATVTFPTSTYVPSGPVKTLDLIFTVPSLASMKTSTGGSVYIAKFPWEL